LSLLISPRMFFRHVVTHETIIEIIITVFTVH
jgi:hypothetical protein